MNITRTISIVLSAAILAAGTVQPTHADDLGFSLMKGKPTGGGGGGGGGGKGKPGSGGGGTGGGGGSTSLVIIPGDRTPVYYSWMASDVPSAWSLATGLGTRITVVDDYISSNLIMGTYGEGLMTGTHGDWTSKFAALIAPGAEIAQQEFTAGQAVALTPGFDVINASYGMMGAPGQGPIAWSPQEQSIIDYAFSGEAFVAKAAGNDSVPMGSPNANGDIDYLAQDLKGAGGVIFVGATSVNGYNQLAWYSNSAGTDPGYNSHYLFVGVEDYKTLLAGTSFAAPIVAGYAAIVADKFDATDATLVANRLLDSARRDFAGYDVTIHGMGEASISRAVAPNTIDGL